VSLKSDGFICESKTKEGAVVEFVPVRISRIMPFLSELGYNFFHISTIDQLLNLIENNHPKIIVLASCVASGKCDNFKTDLEIAKLVNEKYPDCNLLFVIDSKVDIDTCIQAIDIGVCRFVNIDVPQFKELLDEQIYQIFSQKKTQESANIDCVQEQTGIATQSSVMFELLARARKAASICDVPIVIEGESGTGKQLLAEAIHKMDSKRKTGPFLSINCASITGTLAESELFGHRKGAFTGATEDRLGYFRSANGGTLLLDEISELEPRLQPKLLRVLQENKILPVGDDREYTVDVRIIAASNKSLAQEIAENRFRLDLYQRLNVIKLSIPPLRERVEDIPLLVQYFIKKYKHYCNEEIKMVDPAVYAVLKRAIGRGNVRELENIIRQTLAFKTSGTVLTIADLPNHILHLSDISDNSLTMPAELRDYLIRQINHNGETFSDIIQEFEASVLSTAINHMGLRGTKLAQKLGLNRRTLYNKLKRYHLLDSG